MLLPQGVRPLEQLDRFVKALLRRAHPAKTVVGVWEFRIDVFGLLALVGSLFVVLLLAQRIRPVAQSALTVLRLMLLPQGVRPLEQLDRFVKALLRRAHPAKTVVGVWEFRIDVFGLLALFGSLFVVLLLAQGVCLVAQSVSTVLGFLLLAQPVLLGRDDVLTVVVRTCLVWMDGH